MSVVTNIILHCSYGEDHSDISERDGGLTKRIYKGPDTINQWLNGQGRELGELVFMNPHAGGTQIFSGAIFMGAFNYLDLDGLAEQIKSFTWDEPNKVQLFVREDEDDVFWEYDLGNRGEENSQED